MKLTYVYDLKFQTDGQHMYSKNFSDVTWQKYLNVAEEIHIYPILTQVKHSTLPPIQSPLHVHPWPYEKTAQLYSQLSRTWQRAFDIASKIEGIVIRLPSHMGVFVGLACIKLQKPYMVEIVGNAYEAYRLQGNPLYKTLALPIHEAMKKIVHHAKVAVYVTHQYLQTCYPTTGTAYTVPNAIIREQPCVERPTTFTVGMIGSMGTKYKGHDTLFRALSILDRYALPIQVKLLGEDQRSLPTYKHIQVTHEGILSNDSLQQWYQQLSLYVQPSYTEAIGRSIMESMSYGLPAVASEVGGIPELLEKRDLFPVRDAEQFAKKIAHYYYDPLLWKRTGSRNQRHIQTFRAENAEKMRALAFNHYGKYL